MKQVSVESYKPVLEPWEMSRADFNRRYYQHTNFRGAAIPAEGFKSGIGPNVWPPTEERSWNVLDRKYATKAGVQTFAVPKEWVNDTPNGPKIVDGWKPKASEIVYPTIDCQPLYDAIVDAAIARGKKIRDDYVPAGPSRLIPL